MAYMAVGSRQILFADTPAPASVRDDIASVSSLTDNPGAQAAPMDPAPQSTPVAESTPPPSDPPPTGANVDVRA